MDRKEAIRIVRMCCPKIANSKCDFETAMRVLIPELKESEDEKIKKSLVILLQHFCKGYRVPGLEFPVSFQDMLAWLKKQGEQKSAPFKAEHGKYYYCIKDYFSGGKKQASKGDVVQALRGLPIIGLDDANEYFLPVNSVQKPAWSEEDEKMLEMIISDYTAASKSFCGHQGKLDFLKSLKERYTWKPSDKQMYALIKTAKHFGGHDPDDLDATLESLYNDLKKLKG